MQIHYFVSAKKRENAPIYVRLSAERGTDLVVKTGLLVDPKRWSNKMEATKQRIISVTDQQLTNKLERLKDFIKIEYETEYISHTREWLELIITQFHSKKVANAKNLNDFIDKFITDSEKGEKKNKSGVNFADGTVRILKGFQRIFNEYQGQYTPKRIQWLKDEGKPPRPLRQLDFENINIDFYSSFINFLTDQGYALNTMGRFIKSLKMLMKKALQEKLHTNREFEYQAFRGLSENTYATYLNKSEIDKIYNLDLTKFPRMGLARDAFVVLCETCLRISDYSKIDVNVREINNKRFVDIQQTKTGSRVIIPLSQKFEAIWKKYNNKLPRIPEQHVNEDIKVICKWCGINEELHWQSSKFGKTFQRSAQKWELITCHSGRRSACTNMYLAEIPLKDIREISGHSSDKQLLDYIKITKEETALRLADHPYFSGNVLKIV